MFHLLLVAPRAFKSVLPVQDSLSNKEMRRFISRINAHQSRTVAWKFSTEGLWSSAGGLDIIKLTKTPHVYSVSRFNLGA